MSDRKAELERKKKRLEEIRAAKSKKVFQIHIINLFLNLNRGKTLNRRKQFKNRCMLIKECIFKFIKCKSLNYDEDLTPLSLF